MPVLTDSLWQVAMVSCNVGLLGRRGAFRESERVHGADETCLVRSAHRGHVSGLAFPMSWLTPFRLPVSMALLPPAREKRPVLPSTPLGVRSQAGGKEDVKGCRRTRPCPC